MSDVLLNSYRYSKPIQEFSNTPNAVGTQNFSYDQWKAERVASSSSVLLGITITEVQMYLYRTGTNSDATITMAQAKTDGTILHTFWTKSFNSLPTSDYTLTTETCIPSTIPLTDEMSIGTWYTTTGSTSGTLHHNYDNSNSFDGNYSTYAGSFSGSATWADKGFEMKGY